MSQTVAIENAAMERQEWQDTKPQDRYAGRLKFTGCRRCGGFDGMQAVHRETLAEMTDREIEALASRYGWYRLSVSHMAEYFYYPCPRCNRSIIISRDFCIVPTSEVLEWIDRDPMAPDCAALAAEGPVLASEDSRASTGLEG